MIYFRLFRRPTLILNSLVAARDLLDKRSVKYSDRPRMVLMSEMYVIVVLASFCSLHISAEAVDVRSLRHFDNAFFSALNPLRPALTICTGLGMTIRSR